MTEGNSGTANAAFTVSRSRQRPQTVSVDYATADGSATAGNDYMATTGTLTFTAGDTTQTVTVTVNGDAARRERRDASSVNLSGPTNATISDAQGVGTITDDDTPPAISIGDATVTEGDTGTTDAVFTVSRARRAGCRSRSTTPAPTGRRLAGRLRRGERRPDVRRPVRRRRR